MGPRQTALALALEKYTGKQAIGHLEIEKDGETCRCVLGVICRIAMDLGLELEVSKREGGLTYFDNVSTHLPDKVVLFFGFYSRSVTTRARHRNFIAENDTHRLPIPKFADLIRSGEFLEVEK